MMHLFEGDLVEILPTFADDLPHHHAWTGEIGVLQYVVDTDICSVQYKLEAEDLVSVSKRAWCLIPASRLRLIARV